MSLAFQITSQFPCPQVIAQFLQVSACVVPPSKLTSNVPLCADTVKLIVLLGMLNVVPVATITAHAVSTSSSAGETQLT